MDKQWARLPGRSKEITWQKLQQAPTLYTMRKESESVRRDMPKNPFPCVDSSAYGTVLPNPIRSGGAPLRHSRDASRKVRDVVMKRSPLPNARPEHPSAILLPVLI